MHPHNKEAGVFWVIRQNSIVFDLGLREKQLNTRRINTFFASMCLIAELNLMEAEGNNYISNAENKYFLDSWFPRSVPSFNQILFPNWFTLKALNFDKGRKVI